LIRLCFAHFRHLVGQRIDMNMFEGWCIYHLNLSINAEFSTFLKLIHVSIASKECRLNPDQNRVGSERSGIIALFSQSPKSMVIKDAHTVFWVFPRYPRGRQALATSNGTVRRMSLTCHKAGSHREGLPDR
jgi:hypothetical protein